MKDGMIHIPARKKQPIDQGSTVRLSKEAYNALVEIFNESTMSMSQIASTIILQSRDRFVYEKRGGWWKNWGFIRPYPG